MLPKRKRLNAQEVAYVLSRGRSVYARNTGVGLNSPTAVSAKYVVNKDYFKCAVVVAKSLAKKATVRNALRRAAYNAISGLPAPSSGAHVLFFVRSIPKKAKTAVFREEIRLLLSKI